MFDTSVIVPAIVSQPGRIPEGDVCSGLLSHYDIMPTLLEYGPVRMIRSRTHKYVHRYP